MESCFENCVALSNNITVGYKIDTLKISNEELNCSIYYNNTINNKIIGFGKWT